MMNFIRNLFARGQRVAEPSPPLPAEKRRTLRRRKRRTGNGLRAIDSTRSIIEQGRTCR